MENPGINIIKKNYLVITDRHGNNHVKFPSKLTIGNVFSKSILVNSALLN